MALFHVFNTVDNRRTGVPLSGVQVRAKFDGTDTIAPIYADDAGTAFDPTNVCTTDADGMFSFYIDAGEYTLEFLVGSVVIKSVPDFRPAEVGPSGPANSSYATTAELESADTANLSAILAEVGKAGTFTTRDYTDFTAEVAADTGKVNYIRSVFAPTKVWVRTSILSAAAGQIGAASGLTVDGELAAKATLTGVARTATHLGTFTGSTIPANQPIKPALQAVVTALENTSGNAATKVNATAVGVAATDANMGTTPGTILSDNGTAKQWFQESEAAIEAASASVAGKANTADLAATTTGKGAEALGFKQTGTGTVAATVASKARQILNAADFSGFDATGVTTSTAAIQNALDEAAARGRHDVLIPKGAKTGALSIAAGAGLVGPKTRATLVAEAGTFSTISLAGSDTSLRNLEITDTSKSGGASITIACGTAQKDRVEILNIITYDSFGGITDSGTGSGVHATTLIRDVQMKRLRGHGVELTRLFAFGWLERVTPDFVGTSNGDFTGFKFDLSGLGVAAGGMNLIDCHVLGTLGATTYANQRGFDIANTAAVWLKNCMADTVCDDGFRFNTINGLHVDGIIASLMGGHGIVCTSLTSSLMARVEAYGRNYLSSPPANKDGLRFVSGCAGVNINGALLRDMTGHGIQKVAAQTGAIYCGNVSIFSNTGRAVKSTGASGFLVNGGQFGSNTAGEYDLAGGFDYLRNVQGNGGGILNVGPGPVTG